MRPITRSRRKLLAGLTIVLAIGLAGTYMLLGKIRERKEIVGKVDPISGIRCRFTVSSVWQRKEEETDKSIGLVENTWFAAPPPSPLWHWIHSHLLHRPLAEPSEIVLAIYQTQDLSDATEIQNGYPEPLSLIHDRVDSLRRLHIDGYPATIAEMESGFPARGASYHWTSLRVYIPNRSILYIVDSQPAYPTSKEAATEMQAIISSFHVEGGLAPAH